MVQNIVYLGSRIIKINLFYDPLVPPSKHKVQACKHCKHHLKLLLKQRPSKNGNLSMSALPTVFHTNKCESQTMRVQSMRVGAPWVLPSMLSTSAIHALTMQAQGTLIECSTSAGICSTNICETHTMRVRSTSVRAPRALPLVLSNMLCKHRQCEHREQHWLCSAQAQWALQPNCSCQQHKCIRNTYHASAKHERASTASTAIGS